VVLVRHHSCCQWPSNALRCASLFQVRWERKRIADTADHVCQSEQGKCHRHLRSDFPRVLTYLSLVIVSDPPAEVLSFKLWVGGYPLLAEECLSSLPVSYGACGYDPEGRFNS
jgi:hypothetical protein